MSTYAAELTTIKRLALQTLFTILQTATDPAELRRTATAILRIPDPKPDKNTPGMSESASESRGYAATATTGPAAIPSESHGCSTPAPSTPAPIPGESHEPPDPPAGEPEGLIGSPRSVVRRSASDTPGNTHTNAPHTERVLAAPAPAPPDNTPFSSVPLLPRSPTSLPP